MKTLFSFILIAACCMCFTFCKNAHTYDKYIKELDSLKVVVEQAIGNFKTVDSLACLKAYAKEYTYTDFINKNLKDTISKSLAENITTFHATGEGIKQYLSMRSQWLNEGRTSIKQLTTLSQDLKKGSVETEEAIDFINNEKRAAEKIIEELKVNTELIRSNLEQYNKSLPATEELVKTLNNGALPTITNPEINSK